MSLYPKQAKIEVQNGSGLSVYYRYSLIWPLQSTVGTVVLIIQTVSVFLVFNNIVSEACFKVTGLRG